jgi:hypothetical protein
MHDKKVSGFKNMNAKVGDTLIFCSVEHYDSKGDL